MNKNYIICGIISAVVAVGTIVLALKLAKAKIQKSLGINLPI